MLRNTMESRVEKIVAVAEKMVRNGGYRAFSFREIAKEVGIKSSSVHYYFPTKADLGAAVIQQLTERYMACLGLPEEWQEQGKDPIAVYIQSFKDTLEKDKSMCVGGLLGAEIDGLPEAVVEQTRGFFERNIEWLERAYELKGAEQAREKAIQTVGLLEGAILLGKAMGSVDIFDIIAAGLNGTGE